LTYLRSTDDEYWEFPSQLSAIETYVTPKLEKTYFVLGDPEVGEVPATMVLKMEAGFVIPRHAHPCERFEVVVSGSIDVGEGVLKSGDVMISKAGQFYGPHIAGPEGCTTVEVFGNLVGSFNILFEKKDGEIVSANALQGDHGPERTELAGMERMEV
jgi:hypothetical protein